MGPHQTLQGDAQWPGFFGTGAEAYRATGASNAQDLVLGVSFINVKNSQKAPVQNRQK